LKIALIQLNAGEDKKRNIERACSLVETASSKGAKFVLLPEVFNYRGQLTGKKLYNEIAEDIPSSSINPLLEISRRENIFILAGSIYERSKEKNKVYNTSVVIDNSGRIIAKYRKINLFKAIIDGSIIDESITFKSGSKPMLFKINDFKIGLSICFDVRFPELYRKYYHKGVDIIVIPSSFTSKTGVLHWEALLRARAIENFSFVLAPNQFGMDGNNVETYGHTMAIDPQGKILGVLSKQKEGILSIELEFDDINEDVNIN